MSSKNRKVVLTFDVELWHESLWLQPYISQTQLQNDTSFENSLQRILRLLEAKGAHATFFVTDKIVDMYPDYIKRIHDHGHEIASHGVAHRKLTDVDPGQYTREFVAHIEKIKQITGRKISGYRAPHFSLTQHSSWILPLLEQCGLHYDASIFPLSLGEYGNSKAPKKPYRIASENILHENDTGALMEIPLSVSTFAFLPIPFAGGVYFRILPLWFFKYFLWKESLRDYPPVLYFHPHELEASTPRIIRGHWMRRMLKYWGTNNSFRKFEKILDWYTFDSIENIYFK